MRRHVGKEVDTSGDCWKAEDSVLFSTPVITVSLVPGKV